MGLAALNPTPTYARPGTHPSFTSYKARVQLAQQHSLSMLVEGLRKVG